MTLASEPLVSWEQLGFVFSALAYHVFMTGKFF